MRCPDPSARLLTKNLKGNPMRAVIFKIQNGVFKFDHKVVKKILCCNRSKYDLDKVANLQDLISTECNETIVIPEEPVYFDSIALDLIGASHGSALCRTCNKTYQAEQLKSIKVGYGGSPFDIKREKKGVIKRLFTKKRKPPTMCGGKGYDCPAGHNLISVITWKTF
jgi:hypothetical protein